MFCFVWHNNFVFYWTSTLFLTIAGTSMISPPFTPPRHQPSLLHSSSIPHISLPSSESCSHFTSVVFIMILSVAVVEFTNLSTHLNDLGSTLFSHSSSLCHTSKSHKLPQTLWIPRPRTFQKWHRHSCFSHSTLTKDEYGNRKCQNQNVYHCIDVMT